MLVKHRQTKKLYKVLGVSYDGHRGLLYKLIETEGEKARKYFYDEQHLYFRAKGRERL
jgi:hypothetical protein